MIEAYIGRACPADSAARPLCPKNLFKLYNYIEVPARPRGNCSTLSWYYLWNNVNVSDKKCSLFLWKTEIPEFWAGKNEAGRGGVDLFRWDGDRFAAFRRGGDEFAAFCRGGGEGKRSVSFTGAAGRPGWPGGVCFLVYPPGADSFRSCGKNRKKGTSKGRAFHKAALPFEIPSSETWKAALVLRLPSPPPPPAPAPPGGGGGG